MQEEYKGTIYAVHLRLKSGNWHCVCEDGALLCREDVGQACYSHAWLCGVFECTAAACTVEAEEEEQNLQGANFWAAIFGANYLCADVTCW